MEHVLILLTVISKGTAQQTVAIDLCADYVQS